VPILANLHPLAPASVPGPSPSPVPQVPGDRIVHLAQSLHAWTAGRPWLLLLALAVLLGGIGGWAWARSALGTWRHRHLATHDQQILILPPPLVEVGGASLWWANLAGLLRPARWRRLVYGSAHIALEYRWTGRQLQIIVWVPGAIAAAPVAAAVRAAWPGASTRIEDATSPLPTVHRAFTTEQEPGAAAVAVTRETGAALVAALPAWYPLATSTEQDSDPLRALVAAGSDLNSSEAACVQILARVGGPRRIAHARAGAAALKTGRTSGKPFALENLLTGALSVLSDLLSPAHPSPPGRNTSRPGADPMRERDARPGLDKLTGPQWEVAIRIGVTHTSTRATTTPAPARVTGRRNGAPSSAAGVDAVARRLSTHAHALASALAVHDARNQLHRLRLLHPTQVLAERRLRAGFLLSTPELASLAGLPRDIAVAGLDRARAKAIPAPITVPGGGRGVKILGRAQIGGHSVALPVADARQHLHILGSTGAGKSTLLTHLILDDIKAGRATILIDPKGDLARDVLERLPASVLSRLVLIDPDQPAGSATFNPLQLRHGADPDLIADNIVAIFAAIFQRAWGPRIDDVVRVSCLTLMRHPRPTLASIAPLLNSKQFRAPFTVGFDDPAGLKGFWEWYESTPPQLRAQVIGPVLARLRSFLLRDFVRATIGPHRSSFDMQHLLDNRGILIARLPKGQLGEDTSRLLGSLIFASVWQAATARARLPEAQRQDAAVYIDEAHNVLNLSGTVSDMLAEARGYRLSMVLAHQHLAQLPRDTQLALSANARNKIFFNCSPEDARQLAQHTLPELDEHDVSHLDAYIAATRLVINNRETSAFTLTTNPPRPPTGDLQDLRTAIAQATAARAAAEPDPDDDEPSTGSDPAADNPAPIPAAPAAASTPETPARTRGTARPRTRRASGPNPAGTPHPSQPSTGHPTGTNPQAGGPS